MVNIQYTDHTIISDNVTIVLDSVDNIVNDNSMKYEKYLISDTGKTKFWKKNLTSVKRFREAYK